MDALRKLTLPQLLLLPLAAMPPLPTHKSSSSISSATPTLNSTTPPSEAAFTCTICWAAQPLGSTPKTLGTSARIVCTACWRAVLDLSICWVCGECIVRGDDVVSLGWCFWHKACFGCLICGAGMSVPNLETGTEEMVGRKFGVELNYVPLCGDCTVDVEGEPGERVLERGLESVSRADGGLSRDRLKMLGEEREERFRSASRRLMRKQRKGKDVEMLHDLKKYINGSSRASASASYSVDESLDEGDSASLLHNAADMGMTEDGAADALNDVYVSIYDPLGEPAFKPSRTKPLPKWMKLLPHNVHREREEQQALKADPVPTSTEMECAYSSRQMAENDTSRDSQELNSSTEIGRTTEISTGRQFKIRFQSRTTNDRERGQADSRACRKSRTGESLYHTPPQSPAASLRGRPKTPYPYTTLTRPKLNPRETTSYFSHKPTSETMEGVQNLCGGLPFPRASHDDADPPQKTMSVPILKKPMPKFVQSSEYLDRYKPKTTGSTAYRKFVAKDAEAILDKIKRQRLELDNVEQSKHILASEDSERVRWQDLDGDLGHARKGDLHDELKKLFS